MRQNIDETTEESGAPGGVAANQAAEEGPRSFTRFVATLAEGEAESMGSSELHALVKRLQETAHMTRAKAKGKLKLTISLVVDVNKTASVFYDINVVQPKLPTTAAVYWLTNGGNLSVTDTRQLELRPRDVGGRREVREAPPAGPTKEA